MAPQETGKSKQQAIRIPKDLHEWMENRKLAERRRTFSDLAIYMLELSRAVLEEKDLLDAESKPRRRVIDRF